MFRVKHAIWRCYPVLKGDAVHYTTSYHLYFRFKFTAKLALRILKAWDALAAGEYLKYYTATLCYVPLYSISNYELPIDYQDCGAWRSYTLDASGDTLEELLRDATISEVNQDGGEIDCYGIDQGNEAADLAVEYLKGLVKNA